MPLFQYRLTCAGETRAVELRRSNPQGWLLDAVTATYPDLALKSADQIIRLRLRKIEGRGEAWGAVFADGLQQIAIEVVKLRL